MGFILSPTFKNYFNSVKSKKVRCSLVQGNLKSLWDAVKIASDVNVSGLPDTLYQNGIELPKNKIAFKKVKTIVESTRLNPLVHNGHQKILEYIDFPLNQSDIMECVKSLKIKNCEGYDQIPQRVLSEGIQILVSLLTGLFKLIISQNKIPDQWRISKTIPIHKKALIKTLKIIAPFQTFVLLQKSLKN